MNENGMGRYHIQSNILLVKLMQVPEIRAQFLTRAGELFQTVFTTENMIALLDEMTAQIQPEMAMHFERWAAEMYPQLSFDQPKNPAGAYAYWQERIERAKNVMKKRPTRFYDMMQETFGLTDEEMAFYDALTRPEAIKDFYTNDQLVAITRELTEALRKNRTIDWQKKEGARAKMRVMIKRLLKKYKYPPEGMEDAIGTVMNQCEL